MVLADGREYIKEFYWEEDEFLDFHHLLSGEPARQRGGAGAADCSFSRWRICADSPLAHLVSPSPEVQLRIKEEKELLLLTESPEARYQHFCAVFPRWRPGVPDHQIAAYLGITPSA